jgi:phytoene synthase
VFSLPSDCRLGIAAARHIYAAIGGEVANAGHDSVTRRARTSRGQKLVLMGQAMGSAALTHVMPRPAQLHARPVPEVAFLVEAAGQRPARSQRSEALLSILAQLEARDRRGAV